MKIKSFIIIIIISVRVWVKDWLYNLQPAVYTVRKTIEVAKYVCLFIDKPVGWFWHLVQIRLFVNGLIINLTH